MGTAAVFDTYAFSKRLAAAGVSAPQAETQALPAAFAGSREDLAIKADVRELRSGLKGGIASLRSEVNGKIALLQRMLGCVQLAGVAALVLKVFFHA